MAHLLEQKVGQVRSQARRLLLLYAAGYFFAALLATLLVLGGLDFLLRFQDHGIRLMSSLAVVLAVIWAAYRFWFVALGRPVSDVEIAQRIERRFPNLTDRLASAIQFLRQAEDDPGAGSAAMRRAAIVETTSALEDCNLAEVLEPRPTRRALTALAVVGAVAIAVVLLSPHSAATALARLARPFGDDVWPQFYQVRFREAPTRLASGQTFEVELLRDAAHRLPDDVKIFYRYENPGAAMTHESEPMRLLNGTMVARKEQVTRPFWYRAAGGDDHSMDWTYLEVVEPPRLESLELSLYPPEYSGLPVESSEKAIRALRGTRVELAGSSNKKLRSATLQQDGAEPLALVLSSDGHGFSLAKDAEHAWVIDRSGPYWIALVDSEGLAGGLDDRWDIRAIADQMPTVTIEQPAGNIYVTPEGEVPLKISAKDDLAIREITLDFNRSDRTDVEDFAVALYAGPAAVVPRGAAGQLSGGELGENQTVEHRWSLKELGLKAGAQISFWATAGDYLPQAGKSTVRKLSIITPAELEERLAQRQTLIVGELQRVLKLQQDARTQTRSLEIQLEQVGQLNKGDVDHAQAAELNQRQVQRTLTSEAEGIPAQIEDFLADLHNNRVDSPELERHMETMRAELERLGREHLGTIERELTSVIKAAQAKVAAEAAKGQEHARPDAAIKQSLTAAATNQDQVIGSLEQMLGELGQWDSYRRFARDIAQVQREQEALTQATKELAQKTLGRDAKDLDAQQTADLKKLANQQIEVSRRFEKVQQQMGQTSQTLEQTDPLSAATIADGLHHAREQGISGQMRQSGEQLDKNQLGQAAARQAKIGKDLEDLLGILSNRREQELSRLVQQLKDAERQLAALRSKQAGLRKQMRAAAENPNEQERRRQLERLAREQKKLEEEAGRLARRLERLQAEQAGRSAAGAAGKMGQAGESGQGGAGEDAEQQAQQAEKDLEEAQRQLAQKRREAEEDLAREQIAKLEDSLKSLLQRQQKLIEETQRLENLRATAGRFTRAQLSTLGDLARQQHALQGETMQLAEKLVLAEVIHVALSGAGKQMNRAGDLLEHRETGGETQGVQESARRRLAQLIAAFDSRSKKSSKPQEGGGDGEGGGGKQERSDGNYALTQLKLLKLLQEDIHERYRELTEKPDEANRAALAEIAQEQGKLAELVMKLSEPKEANPEDQPDKLPDVRQDVPTDGPDELLELDAREPK